jgi:hypothetical protein
MSILAGHGLSAKGDTANLQTEFDRCLPVDRSLLWDIFSNSQGNSSTDIHPKKINSSATTMSIVLKKNSIHCDESQNGDLTIKK